MTSSNRQRYLERRKENIPIPPKRIKVDRRDNMSFFTLFMVVSFMGSMMFYLNVLYYIDISNFGLLRLLLFAMAIGFLIPIKLYRKKLTMSFYEYIIFNIISFAPSSISLLIILNLCFHSNPYIETYKVIGFESSEEKYIYHLENDQYIEEEYIRTIYDDNFPNISGHNYYAIQLADGHFGLRVIQKKLAY